MWSSIIESPPFTFFNWTWCAREPCMFWSAHGLFTPWTMNSSQGPIKSVIGCWTCPISQLLFFKQYGHTKVPCKMALNPCTNYEVILWHGGKHDAKKFGLLPSKRIGWSEVIAQLHGLGHGESFPLKWSRTEGPIHMGSKSQHGGMIPTFESQESIENTVYFL
jgi:hypothetical protein